MSTADHIYCSDGQTSFLINIKQLLLKMLHCFKACDSVEMAPSAGQLWHRFYMSGFSKTSWNRHGTCFIQWRLFTKRVWRYNVILMLVCVCVCGSNTFLNLFKFRSANTWLLDGPVVFAAPCHGYSPGPEQRHAPAHRAPLQPDTQSDSTLSSLTLTYCSYSDLV